MPSELTKSNALRTFRTESNRASARAHYIAICQITGIAERNGAAGSHRKSGADQDDVVRCAAKGEAGESGRRGLRGFAAFIKRA